LGRRKEHFTVGKRKERRGDIRGRTRQESPVPFRDVAGRERERGRRIREGEEEGRGKRERY